MKRAIVVCVDPLRTAPEKRGELRSTQIVLDMTDEEKAAVEAVWATSRPTRTEKVAALAAASGLTLEDLKAELAAPAAVKA